MTIERSDEYYAGLFDGEGSIGLYKTRHKKSYVLTATVEMGCFGIVEAFGQVYGGGICTPANRGWSPSKIWKISGSGARDFLLRIVPHLIEKKEQALLGIEYQDSVRYRAHVTDEEYAYRIAMSNKMRELKNCVDAPLILDRSHEYCAGIFDGEGCIHIKIDNSKAQSTYSLIAIVDMCHANTVYMLHNVYGGRISGYIPNVGYYKYKYRWIVSGLQVRSVLELMLPYLIEKWDQALLGIEYMNNTRYRCRTTPEELTYKEATYLKMKELKRI